MTLGGGGAASLGTYLIATAAQLACWALIVFTTGAGGFEEDAVVKGLTIGGIAFMTFSGTTLWMGMYRAWKRTGEKNAFVEMGIYRIIRHPMYVGFCFISLVFVVSRPSLEAWTSFVLLALVSNLRAVVEEKRLMAKHPEYAEYRTRTKRFIPFLF